MVGLEDSGLEWRQSSQIAGPKGPLRSLRWWGRCSHRCCVPVGRCMAPRRRTRKPNPSRRMKVVVPLPLEAPFPASWWSMDTSPSLQVFCALAELKSLTAAADRLCLSRTITNKHVVHLERRPATRLLNRTSRHVSLAETTAIYFVPTGRTLDALEVCRQYGCKWRATNRGPHLRYVNSRIVERTDS
jgi:hypothetical protein